MSPKYHQKTRKLLSDGFETHTAYSHYFSLHFFFDRLLLCVSPRTFREIFYFSVRPRASKRTAVQLDGSQGVVPHYGQAEDGVGLNACGWAHALIGHCQRTQCQVGVLLLSAM